MAKLIVNIGTNENDGKGDPIRTAFDKINKNFNELYAGNFADVENIGVTFKPDADGSVDLGSADRRWGDVHVKDFIYIGGVRLSVDADNNLVIGGGAISKADVQGDIFADDSTKVFDSATNTFSGKFDGDLTGSVYADDSTVLIDGVAGTISASALTGTLPALDGSALTGITSTTTVFTARADANLLKGEVVYLTGISGNTPTIDKAQANSASTMPAFGIVKEDVSANNNVEVITFGSCPGHSAADFAETGITFGLGDTVYVSASQAGKLTNVAPAGESNLIQNIGKIERATPTTNMTIKVGGAGRTNATPALDEGNIFIGDANNRATTASLATSIGSNIKTINGQSLIGSGNITISGGSGGGSSFTNIGVGADDSTIRTISEGESFLILGGTGITTASDAEGNITITGVAQDFAFSSLTGTPTTLAGYGITDALTAGGALTGTGLEAEAVGAGVADGNDLAISGGDATELNSTGGDANITGGSGALASGNVNIGASQTALVTIGSGSNNVDFPSGTAVDFTGAIVTGLITTVTGDVTGSVFADDSTLLVDGVNGTLNSSALTKPIALADDEKITFGDGDDLEIFHNGSANYIAGAGGTILTGNWLYLRKSGSAENYLVCKGDGAVEVYYDNVKTFATSAAGIQIEQGVEEKFDTLTSSTGTVTHDCDNGHVFYHTGASGDITANFTNLGLTAEYATNLTIIINQGATPYEVTAVQIGGAAQTINWQGGSAPTGNANGIDSFSFTILNDGGSYVVLGQMVDFT